MIEILGNHLWQSTLFAAVVALITLALRDNRAQVKYWLWLAASVKFLVPFSALVALGRLFGWRSPARITQLEMAVFIDTMSQPFSRTDSSLLGANTFSATASNGGAAVLPLLLVAVWLGGCAVMLLTWLVRWWRVSAVVREATFAHHGRELATLRRLETACGLKDPIALASSNASLEPGVFGIVKPVLVWPQGISTYLGDKQVEAILAHEIAHVRRRDNLTAAIHMAVQSIFWFHPLVWWLGGRLVDERERACDEEVIRLGNEPQVYAEGILKTCEFSVESPLVCVAGVTGSDLKKRIEAIMRNRASDAMNTWRRLLLATVGIAAIAGPVALGVFSGPLLEAQSSTVITRGAQAPTGAPANPAAANPEFEVASVKPNKSGDGRVMIGIQPGGRFTATNVPLRMLIRNAYQLQDFQLVGGPGWVASDRFDIVAKAEGDVPPTAPGGPPGPMQLMLRALLADRFKLVVHQETRELSIYALVLARSDGRLGPELRASTVDCAAMAAERGRSGAPPPSPPPLDERPLCGMRIGPGQMAGGGFPLSQFAGALSPLVQRVVVDRTGLTGNFDLDLKWTPDQMPSGPRPADAPPLPAIDPNGPSIFTAVQEQLGLKLDSQRGPVDVLVIDRVEPPTPD